MAVVSRRDLFIEYIKQELFHGFALSLPDTYAATWGRIQSLVDEHREYTARGESDQSTLKRLVPTVAVFLTSLPLEEAWLRYDAKYAVSRRMMVPPSFNEVRHTLSAGARSRATSAARDAARSRGASLPREGPDSQQEIAYH